MINWAVFILSTAYYSLLATKQWSWIFTGQDTGDWLAAASSLVTPQPYGSPLYVLLARLIHIIGLNPEVWLPILLSCIPAAITVALVGMIVHNRTQNRTSALIASATLLSASVFLTQATIIEEYALAVMWVVAAFWAWDKPKRNTGLTMLFLGLGISVHIIVAAIAFLWALVEWKSRREWLRYVPIAIVPVLLYGVTLWTMWDPDTFKWIGGNLSWKSLSNYIGSTSTIGSMALVDTPKRLLSAIYILIPLFGICWIPIISAARTYKDRSIKVGIVIILFSLWLYITNQDYTTWTFLCYGIPFCAVLAGLGAARMPTDGRKIETGWIIAQCVILVILNTVYLNANKLATENPRAEIYQSELESLPDGTVVVSPTGGAFGLGLMYVIEDGKDLIPLAMVPDSDPTNYSQIYLDYLEQNRWNSIQGISTAERINSALSQGMDIYIPRNCWESEWRNAIDVEESNYTMLYQVTGADEDYRFTTEN